MRCYSVTGGNATGYALLTSCCSCPSVNKCFLRGMPWLCKYVPKPKNARLLIPDPENEPDFYTLSKVSPLPDQAQDESVSPSVPKKHSSSTQMDQSPPSSNVDPTKFAFAEAASDVAGHPNAALQLPIISTAALGAPFNTANLPPPNFNLTFTPHLDQLRLMQASAFQEEQDRLYKNALQRNARQGDSSRNNGRFGSGFPF